MVRVRFGLEAAQEGGVAGDGQAAIAGLADFFESRADHPFLVFDGIVITTHEGHNHFRIVAKQLFQQQTRPHGAVTNFQRRARFFFSAETTEKLIQIVNDAHLQGSFGGRRFELLNSLTVRNHQMRGLFKSFNSFNPFK